MTCEVHDNDDYCVYEFVKDFRHQHEIWKMGDSLGIIACRAIVGFLCQQIHVIDHTVHLFVLWYIFRIHWTVASAFLARCGTEELQWDIAWWLSSLILICFHIKSSEGCKNKLVILVCSSHATSWNINMNSVQEHVNTAYFLCTYLRT